MTTAIVEGSGAGESDCPLSTDPLCPRCGVSFKPRRRNQRYCVPECQRKASRNTTRGSQKVTDSSEAARLAELHRDRALLLVDHLYSKPPAHRPAFMEAILTAAVGHDWHLRRILTDRRSLAVFGGRSGTGRPTLARALDDYCRRTRDGARVWQVLAEDWEGRATTVRPLALYRDPWMGAEPALEGPREVHVLREPKAFFAQLSLERQFKVSSGDNRPFVS